MPGSTRANIKQKMDVNRERCERNREDFIDLAALYREHHPDYADKFMILADGCDRLAKAIDAMKATI